jgi:hypothetical protein
VTTPAAEEDEFTELLDADFPRVDLVGKGANGAPGFLVMKQEAGAGLMPPDLIRDLIAKAGPSDAGSDGQVTMTGSAAAIAKLIHGMHNAPVRTSEAEQIRKAQAEYEQVIKAKYNADDLKRMAGNGQAMKDESYPIGDAEDLDKAIHAVGRGGAGHNAIRRHVIARAKALGKSSMIPDNWAADGSLKEAVSKDMGPELDDGIDGMDPTVPLAAPDEEAPGDPTDPGSPAWEAIDAATASKWTSILSRARVAIDILAEREMLEAASADPDDAENAWDLQDVCCAIDYAISVLAPFAVAEQSGADCGADAMAAIGKAMAGFDGLPMDRIEALSYVAKAGRVLSSANEAEIRSAAASLQKVLTSLPQAPAADDPVIKEEAAMAGTETTTGQDAPVAKTASPDEQARDTGPVSAGGTTGLGAPRDAGPDAALPGDGPQQARPGDAAGRQVVKAALQVAVYDQSGTLAGITDPAGIVQRVAKADGDGDKPPMQAVFDQDGDLIGVVDPSAIMPVAGAGSKPPASDGDGPAEPAAEPDATPAADAGDMTPAPPADAGTPADDVAKQDGQETGITLTQDVLKSVAADAARTALEAQGAAHQEVIAKMAADNGELAEELRVVKARLETVENSPAIPKVFTNGQTPPAHQLRGQDRGQQGAPQVDVAKAAELKGTLYRGTAPEQNQAAIDMQTMAIAQLTEIHSGRG